MPRFRVGPNAHRMLCSELPLAVFFSSALAGALAAPWLSPWGVVLACASAGGGVACWVALTRFDEREES